MISFLKRAATNSIVKKIYLILALDHIEKDRYYLFGRTLEELHILTSLNYISLCEILNQMVLLELIEENLNFDDELSYKVKNIPKEIECAESPFLLKRYCNLYIKNFKFI